MITKELVNFVQEARRRGFSDDEIKSALIKQGWPSMDVDGALVEAKRNKSQKAKSPSSGIKERITINLDRSVLDVVKKRAKKNMMSVEEQIEDIVRRSCASSRKLSAPDKNIDDLLVGIFSRKRR